MDVRSAAARAFDPEGPVECVDTVGQTSQSGSAGRISTAGSLRSLTCLAFAAGRSCLARRTASAWARKPPDRSRASAA